MSFEIYRSFREKYKPPKIRILFIAESPPKLKKGELPYFYNKEYKQKGLWWYFKEALYNRKSIEKAEYLERFQKDGYYLIDVFSTRQELCEVKNEKEDLV